MSAELVVLLIGVLGTGLLAGLLAGLLGIGGGLVFVPALLLIFSVQGVPPEVAMHLAVGSSLAAIVLTSMSSIAAHARRAHVDWRIFRALLPGLLAGGVLGAALAAVLDGAMLRRVFAVFMFLVAVQLLLDRRPDGHRAPPAGAAAAGAGTVIGTIAALLGIGGGVLTAPYLMWCNQPVLRAVGTAAAAGLPLALAGAAGFVVVGWGADGLPSGATGFVAWPAAMVLGVVAMSAAPFGARLATVAPAVLLRRVFAVALVAVAVRLAIP